jgi:hypothetical protein
MPVYAASCSDGLTNKVQRTTSFGIILTGCWFGEELAHVLTSALT